MKYKIYPRPPRQDEREEFNRKLLKLIDNKETEKYQISADDVYNAYTGDGGLHGLERKDYDNYHSYSKDKKEIENGQVFTPPMLAKLIVDCISPAKDETVADLTCGAGAFFNFLPNEKNIYGCEIDIKAYKVAKFLYPDANTENKDIRSYKPMLRFDYVIGNPPFNLNWWVDDEEEIKSQLYFCKKASTLLKPKGIMAIIVPLSFLADDFANGSDIALMEENFNFLGQISLPADSFKAMGVSSFDTKLQFWQKKSETDNEVKVYKQEMAFTVLKNGNYDEIASWVAENLLSRYVVNSLFVSVVATFLYIICSSMMAFGLSKGKFKGKKTLFWIIQFALMFNTYTLSIPSYIVYAKLDIIDTYWIYILPHLASTLGVFLMKQYMEGYVPDALIEAAKIDGAGYFRVFWNIVMPTVKPAWLTLMLFGFRDIWNTVPNSTIFTEKIKTLPMITSQIVSGGIARSGSAMAMTVIMMIPPILVYLISQSNVVEAMTSAGIKE